MWKTNGFPGLSRNGGFSKSRPVYRRVTCIETNPHVGFLNWGYPRIIQIWLSIINGKTNGLGHPYLDFSGRFWQESMMPDRDMIRRCITPEFSTTERFFQIARFPLWDVDISFTSLLNVLTLFPSKSWFGSLFASAIWKSMLSSTAKYPRHSPSEDQDNPGVSAGSDLGRSFRTVRNEFPWSKRVARFHGKVVPRSIWVFPPTVSMEGPKLSHPWVIPQHQEWYVNQMKRNWKELHQWFLGWSCSSHPRCHFTSFGEHPWISMKFWLVVTGTNDGDL